MPIPGVREHVPARRLVEQIGRELVGVRVLGGRKLVALEPCVDASLARDARADRLPAANFRDVDEHDVLSDFGNSRLEQIAAQSGAKSETTFNISRPGARNKSAAAKSAENATWPTAGSAGFGREAFPS